MVIELSLIIFLLVAVGVAIWLAIHFSTTATLNKGDILFGSRLWVQRQGTQIFGTRFFAGDTLVISYHTTHNKLPLAQWYVSEDGGTTWTSAAQTENRTNHITYQTSTDTFTNRLRFKVAQTSHEDRHFALSYNLEIAPHLILEKGVGSKGDQIFDINRHSPSVTLSFPTRYEEYLVDASHWAVQWNDNRLATGLVYDKDTKSLTWDLPADLAKETTHHVYITTQGLYQVFGTEMHTVSFPFTVSNVSDPIYFEDAFGLLINHGSPGQDVTLFPIGGTWEFNGSTITVSSEGKFTIPTDTAYGAYTFVNSNVTGSVTLTIVPAVTMLDVPYQTLLVHQDVHRNHYKIQVRLTGHEHSDVTLKDWFVQVHDAAGRLVEPIEVTRITAGSEGLHTLEFSLTQTLLGGTASYYSFIYVSLEGQSFPSRYQVRLEMDETGNIWPAYWVEGAQDYQDINGKITKLYLGYNTNNEIVMEPTPTTKWTFHNQKVCTADGLKCIQFPQTAGSPLTLVDYTLEPTFLYHAGVFQKGNMWATYTPAATSTPVTTSDATVAENLIRSFDELQ